MDKKVSIVLPTCNGAKYIKESIDSCLNQTHKNIELIIVDNGSADDTPKIIAGYTDNRIKYVRENRRLGLANALNKGFSLTSGEYLTWTSDDNYYTPNAIESMLNFLNSHPEIAFVYSNFFYLDEQGNAIKPKGERTPQELIKCNCVGPCFLYRREVYSNIGNYNPAVKLAEDYDYWLRIYKRFKVASIDDFLYYYRIHPDSLSGRYGRDKAKDYADRVRDKHFWEYKVKRRLSLLIKGINDRSPQRIKRVISRLFPQLLEDL